MISVGEFRKIADSGILLSIYEECGFCCVDLDTYDTLGYDDCMVKRIEFSKEEQGRLLLIV